MTLVLRLLSIDILAKDEELNVLVDVHLGPERLDEVDGMNSLDLGIHVLLR